MSFAPNQFQLNSTPSAQSVVPSVRGRRSHKIKSTTSITQQKRNIEN